MKLWQRGIMKSKVKITTPRQEFLSSSTTTAEYSSDAGGSRKPKIVYKVTTLKEKHLQLIVKRHPGRLSLLNQT